MGFFFCPFLSTDSCSGAHQHKKCEMKLYITSSFVFCGEDRALLSACGNFDRYFLNLSMGAGRGLVLLSQKYEKRPKMFYPQATMLASI
jgi:hypothetical protein